MQHVASSQLLISDVIAGLFTALNQGGMAKLWL